MKKFLAGMIVMLLAGIAGCSSGEYDKLMKQGIEAMEDERYQDALTMFEDAKVEEGTKEAKHSAAVAEQMAKSRDHYAGEQYKKSIEAAQKVMDYNGKAEAVDIAKPQAKRLISLAEKARKQIAEMEEELEKGKKLLEAGKVEEANEIFLSISRKDLGEGEGKAVVEEADKLLASTQQDKKKETPNKPPVKPNTSGKTEKPSTSEKPAAPSTDNSTQPPDAPDEQEEEGGLITAQEAEQAVKSYIGLSDDNIKVRYDHMENGDYVVQVYEIVIDNPETKEGHSATLGWYGVNPQTKEVYEITQ